MSIVFPLYCLAPLWWYKEILKQDQIIISNSAFYQRQTYYNRFIIPAPNKAQKLTIPVVKRGQGLNINKVEIAYDNQWQQDHWKSLKTAYGKSAYYEFYDYVIEPLFNKRHQYLFDFNLELLKLMLEFFEIDKPLIISDAKISIIEYPNMIKRYPQMFEEKHGFIHDASILDLLFNMGKEGRKYIL